MVVVVASRGVSEGGLLHRVDMGRGWKKWGQSLTWSHKMFSVANFAKKKMLGGDLTSRDPHQCRSSSSADHCSIKGSVGR
jgi:hypothetical protein